jgi:hypothetical protein
MRQYLLTTVFLFHLSLACGQAIDDVKKLGLTDSQIRMSFEKRQILLTNNLTGKRKRVKEGAFATIKMKGDTTKMVTTIEAVLTDTIIVSSLAPRLVGREIKLGFTGFKLLPIKDIEWIVYSVRHVKVTFWVSFIMTLGGLEMAVLPVIMPLLIGNSDEIYSEPQFPFIVIGGAALFICGRKLQKTLRPKEYKFGTDWNYRVVKK